MRLIKLLMANILCILIKIDHKQGGKIPEPVQKLCPKSILLDKLKISYIIGIINIEDLLTE